MRQPLRATVELELAHVGRALDLATEPASLVTLGGVSTDSRDVQPGDLFVALSSESGDGHDYLEAALTAGAGAVLVSRAPESSPAVPVYQVEDTLDAFGRLARYWRRHCGLRLAAVTGSNGKTTTKEMIAAVLAEGAGGRDRVLVTPGNFNNHVGLPLTLLGAAEHMSLGVVELGMNAPGEIDGLTGLAEPDVGLVTNAAEAHLARFDGVDGVARAKAELWGRLAPTACAVVPADDSRLAALATERFAGETLRFGVAPESDVRVVSAEAHRQHGLNVRLDLPEGGFEVTLPVLGRHNALNAAAATATCLALGVDADTIRQGLAKTAALPHRARLVQAGNLTLLDDCYNANPASARASAQTLVDLPGSGRLGAVVGDMLELGDQAESLHRSLGTELVALGLSVVIGLGPLSAALCDGARDAGAEHVAHVQTAEDAARAALSQLGAGDRLLIKGSRSMGLEAVVTALTDSLRSSRGGV